MPEFDITAWLDGLGLAQYAPAFVDNAIAADVLPTLTADDLTELGVTALGDRKRLLAAIAAQRQAPAPPAAADGERRQVTILFCDLVDFTGLGDRLGAEATHALLNRYFATVDGLVQAYGGTVDKHIGDNVMALFGAPRAHTDDPERAGQLAIAIHAAIADLAADTGLPIAVHIGIASGQVVASGTGSAAHHEYTVTGPAVNLAARLHEHAAAGETLIAESVHVALSDDLLRESLGEVTFRGMATPQRVWRLTGRSGAPAAPATGLVGRVSECAQFAGIVKACRDTASGRLVYLRGDAGIGKSRLLAAFVDLAAAQGFACHRALVLDFGEGRGQDVLRTLVRSLLGVTGAADETTRRDIAEAAVAAGWVDPEDRMFIVSLLDVPLPDDLRGVYEAMDNGARTDRRRETLAHLAAGIAGQTPIAIAVEDVHWAGAAELLTLAAVAAALASLPGLVILTTRADGDPMVRGWRDALHGRAVVTMDLAPLAPAESLDLARQWAADDRSAFTRRAVERADGNPLFLEQLLRGGERGGDDDLPGTVRSVVLARVDGLPADDKQAVQAASVMGQRFSLASLRFVLEQPHYDPARLLDDNLIRAHGGDLLFAHALIRDGVYSSLLKARLRQLHIRAAQWFEGRDQVLQAEHLDRAGDPAAPGAYLAAARGNAAEYRFHRALELVERALPIAFEPEQVAVLTCFRGDLLRELGDLETSIATFRDAAGEAPDDACRLAAWIGLAEGLRIVDAQEEAIEVLGRAQPLAERSGRGDLLARIHTLRGNLCFPIGDFEGCRTEHEKALHYARATGLRDAEAQALGGLGDAAYFRAHMISAERHYADCVRLAHDHGMVRVEAANLPMLGFTQFFQNRAADAIAATTKAAKLAETIADLRAESLAHDILAAIYLELDSAAEAEASAGRSVALARTLGSPRFASDAFAHLSMVQYHRGETDLAEATLQRALTASREFDTSYASAWILAIAAVQHPVRAEKVRLLDLAETKLGGDSVSHNHLHFAQYAIEASLDLADWDRVRRHAEALRAYTAAEPFPWATFQVARAFALAEHGAGGRQPELLAEITRLRDEADAAGLGIARRALTAALDQP